MVEQLPSEVEEQPQSRREKLERLGAMALVVFTLGVFLLALLGIAHVIMVQHRMGVGLFLLGLLALISCGLFAVYVLEGSDIDRALSKLKSRSKRELSPPDASTGKLLDEPHMEPVPTITERTTELLPSQTTRTNNT